MAVKESYAGKINRKLNKKLHVIDVAAGRRKADLVLKNATYVNVFSNELCQADIAVAEGGAADRKDIMFLGKLPVFNADGTVKA